jgi:glycosyltransferase involved in cell wall biosynthesis
MEAFDILLLWNVDWFTDTWSRVVTEAMASGMPVVTENRGGPIEQIEAGKTGLVAERDQPEAAANWVSALAKDPTLREAIGKAGREHATANYGLERLREDLRDFFFRAMIGAR